MKYLLQILPWAVSIFVTVLLLRCCSQGPTPLPPEYDSLVAVTVTAEARANKIDSALSMEHLQTDSLIRALNRSQADLNQERILRRQNPRVIEVIKEIPAVDSAFKADDAALAHCDSARIQLQHRYYGYRQADSVLHLLQDSVVDYLKQREQILAETLQGMQPPGPWSVGVSAGLGAVYSRGQVYAGPGLQVGVQYRIQFKKRRSARR